MKKKWGKPWLRPAVRLLHEKAGYVVEYVTHDDKLVAWQNMALIPRRDG